MSICFKTYFTRNLEFHLFSLNAVALNCYQPDAVPCTLLKSIKFDVINFCCFIKTCTTIFMLKLYMNFVPKFYEFNRTI